MRRLSVLHRWLGLVAALALLLFGSSGLLHIALSRLQPQPAAFAPPAIALPSTALSVADALQANGIARVVTARSVTFNRHAFYRVRTPEGTRHYLEVTTGKRLADGETRHAVALARHFSGDLTAPIRSTVRLAGFDADYLPVNRLLPVWRVELDRPDRLTVYVDTEGNRLATVVDNRKRSLQSLFRQLHSFDWAASHPWLRLPLMLLLLGATAATAVVGIELWRRRRYSPPSATRRWHRRIGLAVVTTTLAFAVSGAWRLLQGDDPPPRLMPEPEFAAATLTALPPPGGFVLIDTPGGPCYLALPTSMPRAAADAPPHDHRHSHHQSAQHGVTDSICEAADMARARGEPHAAERQRAVQLARHYAGSTAEATEVTLLRHFDHEYGFINKRLPVWRVVLANDPTRWYVETATGALARRVDTAVAIESALFSWLHKWQFFGNAKGMRDTAQVLFVSGNIATGLAGLLLWARRRR